MRSTSRNGAPSASVSFLTTNSVKALLIFQTPPASTLVTVAPSPRTGMVLSRARAASNRLFRSVDTEPPASRSPTSVAMVPDAPVILNSNFSLCPGRSGRSFSSVS